MSVLAHLRANHDRILGKLVEFASIPSVSTSFSDQVAMALTSFSIASVTEHTEVS